MFKALALGYGQGQGQFSFQAHVCFSLELEGESSSAKRRNDDDGESSSEEVTVGLFEYETVHGIGSYVSSEEDMPEAKERSSRAAEEILIQPEAKDDCEGEEVMFFQGGRTPQGFESLGVIA